MADTVRGGGTTIFGWCLVGQTRVWTEDAIRQHQACIVTFKSTGTGKTYICQCECHKAIKKDLEELI